jgi:hypothetical protein
MTTQAFDATPVIRCDTILASPTAPEGRSA